MNYSDLLLDQDGVLKTQRIVSYFPVTFNRCLIDAQLTFNRFLDLKDLFNANLVCRTWYWRLWRETEQRELWIPKMCKYLTENDSFKVQRYNRVMYDLNLRGMIRGATVEDCVTTVALIKKMASDLIIKQAHGIFQAGLISNLFLALLDASNVTLMLTTYDN
jgi:hypothetical protein